MSERFVLLVSVLFIVMIPTLPWAATATEADFDGSGKVDFGDFLLFAGTMTRKFTGWKWRTRSNGPKRACLDPFTLAESR